MGFEKAKISLEMGNRLYLVISITTAIRNKNKDYTNKLKNIVLRSLGAPYEPSEAPKSAK
jgi:hypothetical protein